VHLGTARTALVAWLRARREGGVFVMRIEDLDAPRVRSGATESILEDLRWLGLDWDEGPDIGGPHAPYAQSERLDRYEAAAHALRARGMLFPCTCSRKEIAEIASAPHGEEALYPGTCREAPSHAERAPAWRFRQSEPPSFVDVIAGPSRPGLGAGDFVVRRADGVFAYQLAVVVDDRAMGITEVVRGDDLIASTPRQIALHRALAEIDGLGQEPSWAHVPLVLGSDGERLGKRHGSVAIAAARGRGVSPERVVATLARTLGLAEANERELSARMLIERFELERLPRAPSVIDPGSL
jgi:glutamyl-tRNA synthetase